MLAVILCIDIGMDTNLFTGGETRGLQRVTTSFIT